MVGVEEKRAGKTEVWCLNAFIRSILGSPNLESRKC